MTVRLRIAPSPTGLLHVGNARSAVFNWLYARHHDGVFIVRVDDTDTARSEERYVDQMMESFRWLGLDWDEGIGVGGPHGSYRQSDRFDRYREVADLFVATGVAYRCFCTPEELDERRKEAQAAGRPPGYDGRCRNLDATDAADRVARGERASVRMAVPRPGATEWRDLVREEMRFDHEVIDDFVILRSNGYPTYHLASTVDDVDYEITHVARGEDLLSSTPKHILITEAMGAQRATYAHLPLLFGPDGKKLSKRHGDTSMAAYIEAGYLPEALFNYLSLLGWSLGPEETIFTRDQAIEAFDLADVSKNPAVFDTQKLQWMNGEYMRRLAATEFVERSLPFLEEGLDRSLTASELEQYRSLAPHVQERVKLLPEVTEMVRWLFVGQLSVTLEAVTADIRGQVIEPLEYDEASWTKVMETETAPAVLERSRARLDELAAWTAESIEGAMRGVLEELELSPRKGFQPLRVALTGSQVSPPLFESMEVLGKKATLDRLDHARRRLGD